MWLGATTLYFGTLAATTDVLRNLVAIDTQMTEMQRVMDSTTNFNQLLVDSVQMSKDLGRNLQDVNAALIMAAKTGADARDSLALAETSVIASNISELTAEEAMNNLISVTTQFNLKASESIDVINKLNEVDNSYATSTRDLSDALARAGSVAETYNLTLDETIGLSTAMQVATRASGSEVGTALKSIITRLSSNDSVNALHEVGIEIENLSDASEIFEKINASWSGLNDAQKQNLGLVIAGRWQVSKFLGLMNNYQMAIDSTDTAMNSQNSAIIENQKYLQSMEAKIANLRNAWIETSLAIGGSGVESMFVGAVEGLTDLSESATDFIDTFGTLPPLFALASASILLFSKNARTALTTTQGINAVQSTFANTIQKVNNHTSTTVSLIKAETAGLKGMQKATVASSVAWNTLGTSMRAAIASTGIGLIIVGITTALGYGIQKMMEYNKEQKAIQQEAEQLAFTYSTNETQIKSLVAEYENLNQSVQSGSIAKGTEEYQRYLDVQSELNEKLPLLTDHVDENGQAHLKTTDLIKTEIEYLDKLASLESQKFVDNFTSSISKINEEIDKTRAKINSLENPSQGTDSYSIASAGSAINSTSSTEDQIAILIQQKQIEQSTQQLADTYKQLGAEYANTLGYQNSLTEADKLYINELVDKNQELLKTVDGQSELRSEIEKFVFQAGEVRNAIGNMFSSNEISKFSAEQIETLNRMTNALENGRGSIFTWRDSLEGAGFSTYEISQIVSGYNEVVEDNSKVLGENTSAQDENTDSKWENASASEVLFGVTSDQISKMEQAIQIVALLSQVENLSTQQKALLSGATEFLAGMYPNLNGKIAENIGWLVEEMNVLQDLNKASGGNAAVMMSNQDNLTKSTISASNQRILALNKEYNTLSQIMDRYIAANEATDGMVAGNRMIVGVARRLRGIDAELSSAYSTRREAIYGAGVPRSSGGGSKGSGGGGTGGRSGGSGSSSKSDAEKEAEETRKVYEDLADDIVDIYKETYEKQRDLQLDAIDDQIDALEKAYDAKIDMLDDEMDKYDELIKKQLDSIDKQEDSDNYDKELASKQKERQDILNKINVLSMDTSVEGQRRVAELRQELADKELEIEEFKHDREIELRKSSLEQQLVDKQSQIEAQKEQENLAFEQQKLKLEQEREQINLHYENLLNDERKFAEIRRQVMNSEFGAITKDLTGFASELNKSMGEIGRSITQNLIDKINEAKNAMSGLKGGSSPSSGGSSSGGSTQQKRYHTIKSGDTYSELAEQYYGDASKWKKIYDANGIDPKKLQIGSKLLIPYHNGGIVGDKSGGKLSDIVNKLFNTKPNEQVVLALKDELMVPQSNIMKNFAPNMQNLLGSLQPRVPSGVAGNSVTIDIRNINVTGGEQGMNDMFKAINNSLSGKGVKFNL